MSTRRRLVAASPARVAASLGGDVRVVPVLHRGVDAVYVDLDGAALGVLSARATAVPCALRTAEPRLPPDLVAAGTATVGAGRLTLDQTDVVPTRRSDHAVPRRQGRDHGAARHRLLACLDDVDPAASATLAAVAAELPADALDRLADADPAAVLPLLGRGSGLTPVGDDVLCGVLATLVSADRVPADLAATVRRLAPARTTTLSATLLDCALHGEVLPEFRRLLLDLDSPSSDPVPSPVTGPVTVTAQSAVALLRVGHTSGAGLLLGTTIALRHLASRSPTR